MSRTTPTGPRGFTLLELIVALVISTVLLTGMTGAIMVATRAAEVGAGGASGAVLSRDIVEQVTRDVHFATGFSERTDAAITFTVPDRDGDHLPETIRYLWDGVRDVSPGTLTRQYNGGPEMTLATDVKDFRLRYGYRNVEGAPPDTDGGGGGTPLMLVVDDADALTAQETARVALLESWGYGPVPISASASQAELDDAVAAASVCYVVLQNGSEALGTKLRNAAIGIVNEELELHDEFGFSDGRGWPTPTDTLDIMETAHHITTPFAIGDLVIFTSSQPVSAMSSGKASGIEVLGRFVDGGKHSLAVINTGGDLQGGGVAAGPRALLPWGRTGFDIGALNDNGRTILARAIDWANGGGPLPPEIFGYDAEFTTPVNGVERIQIATQATLSASGTVTSISAFVGGVVKKVRYALYSDSGGEPDALLVESAVVSTQGADTWITIPVPATSLAAGDYWLALSFEHLQQRYYQQSPGETRYLNYDARKWGFQPIWTASDDTFGIAISIYATYNPD